MADPILYVDAPARKPRKGGIYSVANVVDNLNRLGASSGINFSQVGCGMSHPAPGLCWGQEVEGTKDDLEGIDTIDGLTPTFAAYFGVECYLNGGPYEMFANAASAGLVATEDRAVEFQALVALQTGAESVPTSGLDYINALDAHADANYIGQPVLWMSRYNAAQAVIDGSLHVSDNPADGRLFSAHGTPVITFAGAGQIFITGWPTVYRSPVVVSQAPTPNTNRYMAIAERAFAVGIDCGFMAYANGTPE